MLITGNYLCNRNFGITLGTSIEINKMKKSNKKLKIDREKFLVNHNFGKTSILSKIRMAQLSEHGLNEILPVISVRAVKNIKKIKKKKQSNTKQANSTHSTEEGSNIRK